ncbi:uncharacterized protein LOC108903182 [Anoplophora glabripennis]|uniref:uncharacterized protein LOC108903182 n=1 Tax=Anoplophora glabripennis TaxID=217634 RepID=UPI000874FCC9|nr:uncharacterized protein LOC108903182 [Anoplophora glabripennis]
MKLKLKRNSLYFCLEFVFGHLALFLVVSIDQWRHYLFDVSRLTQILFVILKDSLLYYIFLITIIIYNALLQLKNHFNSVRTFITNTVGLEDDTGQFTLYRPLEGTITFPATVISDKTLFGLVEASKILSILFECVDIFNQLFGLVIMFINMSTVLTILTSLNTLLVSGETNQLTTEVVLDCIFEALLFLVWNSSILSASGLLKEESSEIVKICCKLQHLLPQSSQERKELLNLAHQIRRKSVTVSASGFFDVDFILILAVFTYVGNYIVVLIQFSHMDF